MSLTSADYSCGGLFWWSLAFYDQNGYEYEGSVDLFAGCMGFNDCSCGSSNPAEITPEDPVYYGDSDEVSWSLYDYDNTLSLCDDGCYQVNSVMVYAGEVDANPCCY